VRWTVWGSDRQRGALGIWSPFETHVTAEDQDAAIAAAERKQARIGRVTLFLAAAPSRLFDR
jgi:hypothetical protein